MSFPVLLIIFIITLFIVVLVLVLTDFFDQEKEYMEEAEARIERGEEAAAAVLLERVVENNPDNSRARWLLARVREVTGEYAGALAQYEYCRDNNCLPEDLSREQLLSRLEYLYNRVGQTDKALEMVGELLKLEPDNPETHLEKARLLYQNKLYEQAVESFEELKQRFSELPAEADLYLARSYQQLDSAGSALESFDDYLAASPDKLGVALEAAKYAEKVDRPEVAEKFYQQVYESSEGEQLITAALALLRLAVDRERLEIAPLYAKELEELEQLGKLEDNRRLEFLYWQGQLFDRQGDEQAALEIYREIYRTDAHFRDVDQLLEQRISSISNAELLDRFAGMNKDDFTQVAEMIARSLGYRIISSDSFGEEEVNIVARDESKMFKINRVLLTFKRWDQVVAEWPLKEFELELLEDRYDRGIFVSPHGFKSSARQFADQSEIELLGPEELIPHLREAFKVYST